MSAMTSPTDPVPTDPSAPTPPPPSPAWEPPRRRDSSLPSIVVGLVILGIGIWYFMDQTLGLTMPRIRWGDLWPILLILLGGVILFRAATDRNR